MATPRVLWKGAISFGLVHIPVALYPASRQERIDFDWLDRRSMQPVGYRRINKETGKEIDKDDIVKGIKGDDDRYVLLSDDEIQAALPKSTQTIEIESFVPAEQIPFFHYDTPYFLAPVGRGEKVYALLRDTLVEAGVVGVAKLVIQTKQHLAALIPVGPMLMVNTLRWANEIRSADELSLPSGEARLSAKERQMAAELVADMRGDWAPDAHRDSFRDEIMALVQTKTEAGDTQPLNVSTASQDAPKSAEIVDLTDLLRRSLKGKGRSGTAANDEGTADRRTPRGAAPAKPSAKPSAKTTAKPKPAHQRAAAAAPSRARSTAKLARPTKDSSKPAAKPSAKTPASSSKGGRRAA